MIIRNSGYVQDEYLPTQHVLGGTTVGGLGVFKPSPDVIFSDGHGWLESIGAERGESQANDHFESYLCTIFNVGGAISDYLWKVYGIKMDFSECIQGVFANITIGVGGTIYNSLKSFQDYGWVDENYRKFTESTSQSQCFAVVSDAIKKIAKQKLADFDVYFDLLSDSYDVPHNIIKDNLKYSEIIVAGHAWTSQDGVYISNGYRANHCFRIGDWYDGSDRIKNLFAGRKVDWSKVSLIAIDSYRFDWKNDPENDHTNVNDFLKPIHKDYQITSAYRVYLVKKKASLTSLLKFMKNLKAYMDSTGLHVWYIDNRGKQEIPLETMAEKALFMCYVKDGIIKTTSYAAISNLPNFKFF